MHIYQNSRLRHLFTLVVLWSVVWFSSGSADAALNARLSITETGLYQLGYEDLGIDQAIPTVQLHLSNRDNPVAVLVDDAGDGWFGPGDTLRFYAQSLAPSDPEFRYTNESIYWLREDTATPVAMANRQGDVIGAAQTNYPYSVHAEQNWRYWRQLPNGIDRDHWFWGWEIAAGLSNNFSLIVNDPVDDTQPVTVRVALQGITDAADNPDHHARIMLNTCGLGDITWDGQIAHLHSFTGIPANCLKHGSNTVRVTELDEGLLVDSIYVDWFEIDYRRSLTARNNSLDIPIASSINQTLSVDGFTSADITVLDISDSLKPVVLSNPHITTGNGVDYSISFSTRDVGEQHFLAITDSAIKPTQVQKPGYSGMPLSSPMNGADYLLITAPELKTAVTRLAQYRVGQGYRVKVITTEQIYDEYAFGYSTPLAIKAFIDDAFHHWQKPAPRFVTLVGDANQDYKDYYNTGQGNQVPTLLIETPGVGEVPSDHRFVTVDGNDELADLLIGRIPAKTSEEIGIFTDKIIAYETGLPGSWPSRIMMASGDHDNRFRDYSNEWMTHVPSSFTRFFINPLDYVDNYLARGDFTRALNDDGVGIVSYFGHGTVDRWLASSEDGTPKSAPLQLIASDDMKSLSNARAIPVFFAFNCLNGLFSLPNEGEWITLPDNSSIKYDIPLPEALIFQDGEGAIAMWSPSSFAYPSEQRWIGNELFSEIFERGNLILGSVVTNAKQRPYLDGLVDINNLDVFTLIGDPATRLRMAGTQSGSVSLHASGGGGGSLGVDIILMVFVLLLLPLTSRS